MPLLARRAASTTERTLVNFRMNMYIRRPSVSVPAPRIKAYRAAAGLGPTSEMGRPGGAKNVRVATRPQQRRNFFERRQILSNWLFWTLV
jgi:hypothetical protein